MIAGILTRMDSAAVAFRDKCEADAAAFKNLEDCMNAQNSSIERRVGFLETWREGIRGQSKLILGISAFMGTVVPLIIWVSSLLAGHK